MSILLQNLIKLIEESHNVFNEVPIRTCRNILHADLCHEVQCRDCCFRSSTGNQEIVIEFIEINTNE